MVYRDGGETGEEVTRRTIEELPTGFRLEDFAGLVASMIERGFLRVELRP